MPTPHAHVLTYYRSPAFAESTARHARDNPNAAHKWLSVTLEQLHQSYRGLRHPSSEVIPLSQFLAGPLTVEQLVVLIRGYAQKLAALLS
jgi:hypothetical protein